MKIESRGQQVDARYEEEITRLQNALASAGLYEQVISGPSFDEIRATLVAVEAEELTGIVEEEEEEHQQEDVPFENE